MSESSNEILDEMSIYNTGKSISAWNLPHSSHLTPEDIPAKCQDNSKTIIQNNDNVSFNEQLLQQWIWDYVYPI